jgi:hypothetical protein
VPCVDCFTLFTSPIHADIVISDNRQLTSFRTRLLILLKVRPTAARDAPAPHRDLRVDSNMARPVVSMELPAVHLDLRVDPRHHSRSMPTVAC